MHLRFSPRGLTYLAALLMLFGACDRQPSHDTSRNPPVPRPVSADAQDAQDAPPFSSHVAPAADRQADLSLVRLRISQFQMGMMVHLTVWAPSRKRGQQACREAFRRIGKINMQMSDYEPQSTVSRLSRQAGGGPVSIEPELFEVLSAARNLAEWTRGLYDPTAGPLVRLWRTARKTQTVPSASARETARGLVGHAHLVLDARNRTARLTRAGMLLDLGGIAKGYAGDQALEVLRQQGITRAAFEAGGDKVLGDPPPGADGWTIDPPDSKVPTRQLANCGVSVSGDTVQFLQIDGKRYSHVVDPRTGMGIESRRMCIVVAADGMTSDSLATLGTLMPMNDFQRLLKQHFPAAEVECLSSPSSDVSDSPRVPPREF